MGGCVKFGLSAEFLDRIGASDVFTLCVTKQYATIQANEQISNSLRLPLEGQLYFCQKLQVII